MARPHFINIHGYWGSVFYMYGRITDEQYTGADVTVTTNSFLIVFPTFVNSEIESILCNFDDNKKMVSAFVKCLDENLLPHSRVFRTTRFNISESRLGYRLTHRGVWVELQTDLHYCMCTPMDVDTNESESEGDCDRRAKKRNKADTSRSKRSNVLDEGVTNLMDVEDSD